MTGAYLRVKRGAKFVNVEIEHLTNLERQELLWDRSTDELIRWIDLLSDTIVRAEEQFMFDTDFDGSTEEHY